jgi:hypothetical protein
MLAVTALEKCKKPEIGTKNQSSFAKFERGNWYREGR